LAVEALRGTERELLDALAARDRLWLERELPDDPPDDDLLAVGLRVLAVFALRALLAGFALPALLAGFALPALLAGFALPALLAVLAFPLVVLRPVCVLFPVVATRSPFRVQSDATPWFQTNNRCNIVRTMRPRS
jgi:hypothetical protein